MAGLLKFMVCLFKVYLTFILSIKTCDTKIYIFCLLNVANYFFLFNHPNYARWFMKYYNLLQLSETYQKVYQKFSS